MLRLVTLFILLTKSSLNSQPNDCIAMNLNENCCLIIPAIKKNVAFADDLVKKLDGISLIQRIISKAISFISAKNVVVITDSEEISLICIRNSIGYRYQQNLKIHSPDFIEDLRVQLLEISENYECLILLWPYVPMLSEDILHEAFQLFSKEEPDRLITVREENHRIFRTSQNFTEFLFRKTGEKFLTEARAFQIVSTQWLHSSIQNGKTLPYFLPDEMVEIENYQDWWVCEKLLQKKRIVFFVIGYAEVGMGHIYRSLALAHEISDHEVIFICTKKSELAANQIAGLEYVVKCVEENELCSEILRLQPDLLICDALNTSPDLIREMKVRKIRTVCFEDLGEGGKEADLTINELFDQPLFEASNTLWGREYFFLRDEFQDASPNLKCDRVENILITFGGTDPENFTLKCLKTIAPLCEELGIVVNVVTGPAYEHCEELEEWISQKTILRINHTNATGVMSHIMENIQLAISSNGRTVYELAHMNIPAIVIPQHEREKTHLFSCLENGFWNIGITDHDKLPEVLSAAFKKLVLEADIRLTLFENMHSLNFKENKTKVLTQILGLLTKNDTQS